MTEVVIVTLEHLLRYIFHANCHGSTVDNSLDRRDVEMRDTCKCGHLSLRYIPANNATPMGRNNGWAYFSFNTPLLSYQKHLACRK